MFDVIKETLIPKKKSLLILIIKDHKKLWFTKT